MRGLVFHGDKWSLIKGMAWARVTGRPAVFPGGPVALDELQDVPLPGRRWVRVRSSMAGICGSDIHLLRLEISRRSSLLACRDMTAKRPICLGHEAIGRVVEVGGEVRSFRVGQRVALVHGIHCESLDLDPCVHCQAGHPSMCLNRHRRPAAWPLGGGWSEHFVRHESQLFAIPEAIPDHDAVLLEPLAFCMHAVLLRPPQAGRKILVVGGGMIGLGVAACLHALEPGASITVLVRHEHQAALARQFHANPVIDHGDPYPDLAKASGTQVSGYSRANRVLCDGFDQVYDCVGTARSLGDSLRWCRPRGTTVLIGIDMFPSRVDHTPIWHREIEVVGAMGYSRDDWGGRHCHSFEHAANAIVERRLNPRGFLTHRFPLERYREAIGTMVDKTATRAIKVAFEFPGK